MKLVDGKLSRYRKWQVYLVVVLVLSLVALAATQYMRVSNLQKDVKSKNDSISKLESDLNTKQATLTDLESQTTGLNKKITSLEATIKELQKGSASNYQAPTYELTINKVRDHVIISGGIQDDSHKYLYVTVTVKNTSSSGGYVSPLDFTLKNSSNEKQPNYKEDSYYNTYYDPLGSAEFLSQSLAGGDSAKGTLLFIVGSSDKNFKLLYSGETHNISVN